MAKQIHHHTQTFFFFISWVINWQQQPFLCQWYQIYDQCLWDIQSDFRWQCPKLLYSADCYKIVDLDMHFNLTFYSHTILSAMVFIIPVLAPVFEIILSKLRNWYYPNSPLFPRCWMFLGGGCLIKICEYMAKETIMLQKNLSGKGLRTPVPVDWCWKRYFSVESWGGSVQAANTPICFSEMLT